MGKAIDAHHQLGSVKLSQLGVNVNPQVELPEFNDFNAVYNGNSQTSGLVQQGIHQHGTVYLALVGGVYGANESGD